MPIHAAHCPVALRRMALALALPLLLAACNDSALKKAAQAADGFALAVRAFQQAEITAHAQGLVADDEHVAIERGLADVANAGLALDDAIRTAASRPRAAQAADAALDALDRLLNDGVLHIKSPQARQDLAAFIATARGFLATIAVLLR